jgi:protocatechuate 3,4-dioxygenase beta subunit
MRKAYLFIAVGFLLSSSSTWAQTGASLSGRVTDQTGAPITGAAVAATNVDTAMSRNTMTDHSGRYQFQALPVGNYEIRASKAGFGEELRNGIVLAAS